MIGWWGWECYVAGNSKRESFSLLPRPNKRNTQAAIPLVQVLVPVVHNIKIKRSLVRWNPKTMAVREVVKRYAMAINPSKQFEEQIPSFVLEGEDENIESMIVLWQSLVTEVNKTFKTKRNVMVTRMARKTLFETALFRLCADFSNRFENIKVEFKVSDDGRYELELVKLSAIPDTCRHSGQNFVAEIPQREYEAEAELVTMERPFLPDPAHTPGHETPTAPVEMVVVDAVEECPTPAAVLPIVLPALSVTLDGPESMGETPVSNHGNPLPISQPVETTTVFQRMTTLESIRPFLSEHEYQEKRQSILNSI